MRYTLSVLLLFTCFQVAFSQPFPNAHAHNDYEHERPLFDALRYGFSSVEADVYLVGGKLLVSHTRPIFTSRTLVQLYLAPLDSILRVNQGKIHAGYGGPFYLMIDLKSEAVSTYAALRQVLVDYPALSRPSATGGVIIFLSGNRPIEDVLKDPAAPVALDGRPGDIGKGYSRVKMPVISDTYTKWSDWNGKGLPGPDDLIKIKELAGRVHAEGKKLRLWAIPDNPTAWKVLLESGVDLINTDKLKELHQFLSNPH